MFILEHKFRIIQDPYTFALHPHPLEPYGKKLMQLALLALQSLTTFVLYVVLITSSLHMSILVDFNCKVFIMSFFILNLEGHG
jgi:hypothetical protein